MGMVSIAFWRIFRRFRGLKTLVPTLGQLAAAHCRSRCKHLMSVPLFFFHHRLWECCQSPAAKAIATWQWTCLLRLPRLEILRLAFGSFMICLPLFQAQSVLLTKLAVSLSIARGYRLRRLLYLAPCTLQLISYIYLMSNISHLVPYILYLTPYILYVSYV